MSEGRPVLRTKRQRVIEATADEMQSLTQRSIANKLHLDSLAARIAAFGGKVRTTKKYAQAEQPGCRAAQRRLRQLAKLGR